MVFSKDFWRMSALIGWLILVCILALDTMFETQLHFKIIHLQDQLNACLLAVGSGK